MHRLSALILFLSSLCPPIETTDTDCGFLGEPEGATNLTVVAYRKKSGEWTTAFSADKTVDEHVDSVILDVRHSVLKCGQRNVVRIRGTVRDGAIENYNDDSAAIINSLSVKENKEIELSESDDERDMTLRFHKTKKGLYVELKNDELSAFRKDPEKDHWHGFAITNRPLEDGELFEVILDETIDMWTDHSFFVGVISKLPDIATYSPSMEWNGTYYLWYNKIYRERRLAKLLYPMTLKNLTVGTRVGVMRKRNRNLHFFLNGEDKGVAAVGIPRSVYGYVECTHYCSGISIV